MIALATVALLSAGAGQDPAILVDQLIRRTNALKSFVAEYRVSGRSKTDPAKDHEGELKLVYRAPHELVLRIRVDDVRLCSAAIRGKLFMRVEGDGRVGQGESVEDASIAEARARAARVFHEQFPALEEIPESAAAGVYVGFEVKPESNSPRPEGHVDIMMGRGDGPLLGWLGVLSRPDGRVTLEEDFLVARPMDDVRVVVSKTSGFLERVEVTDGDVTKTRFELKALTLDGEIEDAEFRLPAADPSGDDISKDLGWTLGLQRSQIVKNHICREVHEAVDSGKLEWNEDARKRLGTSLEPLHTDLMRLLWERNTSERNGIDKFCLRYQQSKARLADGDKEGADALERNRAQFEDDCDLRIRAKLVSFQPLPEYANSDTTTLANEIRRIDRNARDAAYREIVEKPLLRYLADQMERAKRGELQPPKR